MSITLYSAAVPVFLPYLERLHATLDLAEAHAARAGPAPQALLQARLSEDMFPFAQQVMTACSFPLRACCPLLGSEMPDLPGGEHSWEALRARVRASIDFLRQVPADAIAAAEHTEVSSVAGFAALRLSGTEFMLHYALPNFFFHLCMAHAILRQQGVPVGKHDFDGYHAYPAGFSFSPAPAG